jgi:hypothetical protein
VHVVACVVACCMLCSTAYVGLQADRFVRFSEFVRTSSTLSWNLGRIIPFKVGNAGAVAVVAALRSVQCAAMKDWRSLIVSLPSFTYAGHAAHLHDLSA